MEGETAKTLAAFVTCVQGHSAANERVALAGLFRRSVKGLRATNPSPDKLVSALQAVPAEDHPAGHGCILYALAFSRPSVSLTHQPCIAAIWPWLFCFERPLQWLERSLDARAVSIELVTSGCSRSCRGLAHTDTNTPEAHPMPAAPSAATPTPRSSRSSSSPSCDG